MVTMKFLLILFATSIAFSQNISPNCWRDEKCRTANYTSDKWYFGFVEDVITRRQNVAEFRGNLEQTARARMVESIKINIGSHSQATTDYSSVNDMLNINFVRTTQTSADAEVINAFIDSYHDPKTNRIFAFAAVKRSDLVNFYAQMIQSTLSQAQSNIRLAEQLINSDRKRDALQKLSESRKHIETAANYRNFLLAVDIKGGLERSQNEFVNELLKKITALQIEIERPTQIFIATTENTSDIVVSEIQTRLSENNVMVTNNREEANLILEINARICDSRSDGRFHFASACVRAVLTNVRTGRNELTITVNGQREGHLNAYDAGNLAFRTVAPDVWAKISEKFVNKEEK